jgi:hypothetical protein
VTQNETREEHERRERTLARRAGVTSFQDDALLLLDLGRDYIAAVQRKFREEADPVGARRRRLRQLLRLREQACKLDADLAPDLQLTMYDEAPARYFTDRQWPRYVLSVYVEMIEQIWHEHGGRGEFAAYNKYNKKHDGPLIWLLDECFKQIDAPTKERPSPHTVYRAWQDAKKRQQHWLDAQRVPARRAH